MQYEKKTPSIRGESSFKKETLFCISGRAEISRIEFTEILANIRLAVKLIESRPLYDICKVLTMHIIHSLSLERMQGDVEEYLGIKNELTSASCSFLANCT